MTVPNPSLHLINLKHYIMHVAKISNWTIHEIDDTILVLNQDKSSVFNYIFQKNDSKIYSIESAQKAIKFIEKHKYSLSWPIDPNEKNLEKYVEILNLREPGFPKQALLDLKNYKSKATLNNNIKFIPVDSSKKLEIFDILTSIIFSHKKGLTYDFFHGIIDTDPKTSKLKFFIISFKGQYVACCAIFIHENIAGFYTDGVLEEHRNMGIGTSLVQYRATLAKEHNCDYAIAHCMTPSQNLYTNFGFSMINHLPIYSY